MNFNHDTGTIDTILTLDTSFAPPLPGGGTNSLDIIGSGALILPLGTTAQQPGSPVAGMIRYNTDNTKFEVYDGGWDNIALEDFANATYVKLAGSTMNSGANITFIGGGEVLGLPATPTTPGSATSKAYVDGLVQGLDIKDECEWATAVALPAYTYANGVLGVGATITANANGALVTDGHIFIGGTGAPDAGKRVLIKNETAGNAPYNGIYVVTDTGDGGTPFILTRATDADHYPDLEGGMFTFIVNGTVNASTGWVCTTQGIIIVGTTAITFAQFSGTGTYTAGSGLLLTGTQFSVKTDGVTTYIDGSSNVAVKSSGTTNQVLVSQGAGSAAWSTVALGDNNAVSGTLLVPHGGTGQVSFTLNGVLYGNTTSPIQVTAAGSQYQTLQANVTGVPVFDAVHLNQSAAVTGVLAIANGGTSGSTATTAFNNLSPLTTKGDLIVYDGTNNVREPVGTDTWVLTADSTQTTGIKWAPTSSTSLQLYKENPSAPVAPVASGTNAVAIGSGSTASAINGFAVGDGTDARIWSQKAFANGKFATAGDAQHGIYVLRATTTDASDTELFLDGAAQRLVTPNNSVFTYVCYVVARRTDATGGAAGYKLEGVISKDTTAASTAFIGGRSKTVFGETNSPWDADVSADTTNGSLKITVNGQAAKTVRWVATVMTTEVTN